MKYAALINVLAALPAHAHMALWATGMYGGQPEVWDSDQVVQPLNLQPFSKWWFHGFTDQPPPEGEFFELPAGGKTKSWVSCNRHWTPLAGNQYGQDVPAGEEWACPSGRDAEGNPTGMEHSTDHYKTPKDQLKDLRGCGLSIAYESDIAKVKPEDFVVISTVKDCAWKLNSPFDIPPDLPACPAGGCHCLWGWQHGPNGGLPQEMFMNGFKCNVTGATGTRALPKPALPRKCPFDKNNCTAGAKQMMYWGQAEGNNIVTGEYDMPFYNGDWGFTDGAQKDLWLGEEVDKTAYEKGWSTELAPAPRETMEWSADKLKTTANAYLATFTPSSPAATASGNVESESSQGEAVAGPPDGDVPATAGWASATSAPVSGAPIVSSATDSVLPSSGSGSVTLTASTVSVTHTSSMASVATAAATTKKCHPKRRLNQA